MDDEIVASTDPSALVIDPSIVEDDASQTTTEDGQTGDAQSAGTTPPSPALFNWDSDENPYKPFKARYDGLQGNFKQVKQRHDELGQLNSQLTERIIRIQAQNEGLSPEETNQAIAGYHQQAELASVKQELASDRERIATVAALVGPFMAVQQISKQYNVDPEELTNELDGTEGPREIDKIAKMMAKYRRSTTLQSRKENGVDNVGTTGGASQDLSKMSSLDLIKAGFQDLERQRR